MPVATAEWKESCKRAIIPNGNRDYQILIGFQLHEFFNVGYFCNTQRCDTSSGIIVNRNVGVGCCVMNSFEKGKLTDQKKISSAVAKPELKQYYLAPILSLEPQEQSFLLLKYKNGHISLSELKKEANVLTQLTALKKNFEKSTNSATWEDAATQFPLLSCEAKMRKYITLDFSKGIPKSFLDFCKQAKSTKDAGALDSSVDHTYIQQKYSWLRY